jgi:hypothetical protein
MNYRKLVPLIVVVAIGGAALALALVARDDGDGTGATQTYNPKIDPAEFTTEIDNPFMPLRPGTRWVYKGVGDEGETERNVVEVTDETKKVMGVTVVVVRDTVSVDGKVAEDTLDWFAQDADGNVWYFGEDTREIEDGKTVSTEGSWEAGVNGALPGIAMEADPQVGDTYRQEYYKGEAEDTGEVLSLDEQVSVPYGSYDGVLKTEDLNPFEPKIVENKYYAKGVGFVMEETVKGGSERTELVQVTEP